MNFQDASKWKDEAMEHITIDVVSDVVCPWCYLGKARLELAIAEVQDEVGVDINWRPYRLNPDYPPEGGDQIVAEIEAAQKMGVTGVPFFIFDQQYAVSGAQTPDVIASALRDIAKMKREA